MGSAGQAETSCSEDGPEGAGESNPGESRVSVETKQVRDSPDISSAMEGSRKRLERMTQKEEQKERREPWG